MKKMAICLQAASLFLFSVLSACKKEEKINSHSETSQTAPSPKYMSDCNDSGEITIRDSLTGKDILAFKSNGCEKGRPEKNFSNLLLFPIKGDTIALLFSSATFHAAQGCDGSALECAWISTKKVDLVSECIFSGNDNESINYAHLPDSSGIRISYANDSTSVYRENYTITKSGIQKKDSTISTKSTETENWPKIVSEQRKKITGFLETSSAHNNQPSIGEIVFDDNSEDYKKYMAPNDIEVEVEYLSQKMSNGRYRFIIVKVTELKK